MPANLPPSGPPAATVGLAQFRLIALSAGFLATLSLLLLLGNFLPHAVSG